MQLQKCQFSIAVCNCESEKHLAMQVCVQAAQVCIQVWDSAENENECWN